MTYSEHEFEQSVRVFAKNGDFIGYATHHNYESHYDTNNFGGFMITSWEVAEKTWFVMSDGRRLEYYNGCTVFKEEQTWLKIVVNDGWTLYALDDPWTAQMVNKAQQDKNMDIVKSQNKNFVSFEKTKTPPSDFGEVSYYLPGIRERVEYPCTKSQCAILHPNQGGGRKPTLQAAIMSLNDDCKWTREEIADWIETLDIDTTFKVEGVEDGNDQD